MLLLICIPRDKIMIYRRNHGGVDRALLSFDLVAGNMHRKSLIVFEYNGEISSE